MNYKICPIKIKTLDLEFKHRVHIRKKVLPDWHGNVLSHYDTYLSNEKLNDLSLSSFI